jgi:hypothetical protein
MISIRMSPHGAPKASIVDYIWCLTGKNASGLLETLREKPEHAAFLSKLESYRFPGHGQRYQSIMNAAECMKIAMLLPDGSEKERFRSATNIISHLFMTEAVVHPLDVSIPTVVVQEPDLKKICDGHAIELSMHELHMGRNRLKRSNDAIDEHHEQTVLKMLRYNKERLEVCLEMADNDQERKEYHRVFKQRMVGILE